MKAFVPAEHPNATGEVIACSEQRSPQNWASGKWVWTGTNTTEVTIGNNKAVVKETVTHTIEVSREPERFSWGPWLGRVATAAVQALSSLINEKQVPHSHLREA